ncbi:MAG: hypothetical protein OPY06_03605 [Nitrosopumilus sp.]|nr:hypothetical protein [Nitrosopumilus sp.]MDF2422977.1 hypothetical protein [Nitrosopumilus sp.]MDF2423989.1 hypothetical protein [Nitrosopumilus sp.]MDF2428764.1 hypothetical protein [Nitrosopumilus sp.]MDF2430119.1 hypothetical protein [Nitrosopumilus sp.]
MRLEAKRMAQDSLYNLERKIALSVELKNGLESISQEEKEALEKYIDLLNTHKQNLLIFLQT